MHEKILKMYKLPIEKQCNAILFGVPKNYCVINIIDEVTFAWFHTWRLLYNIQLYPFLISMSFECFFTRGKFRSQ